MRSMCSRMWAPAASGRVAAGVVDELVVVAGLFDGFFVGEQVVGAEQFAAGVVDGVLQSSVARSDRQCSVEVRVGEPELSGGNLPSQAMPNAC